MVKTIIIGESDTGLSYTFDLTRHTGKRSSLNKGNQVLNSNDRMNPHVKGPIVSFLRELSAEIVTATNPPFSKENPLYDIEHPCNVVVTVFTPTRHISDPNNVYPTVKAIMDGMTDVGVWSDDNAAIVHIVGFLPGGMSDNKKYRLVVDITAYNQEGEQHVD